MLDTGAHLSALTADSQAFADLAASPGVLDHPVPACPGWTGADLVGHLGGVYGWATATAQAGGERPDHKREQPPPGRGELLEWFGQLRAAVIDALSSRQPDEPAWVFTGGEGSIAWWRRRQSLETAVHLWDLQQAAGAPAPIATELAADGMDELLTEFLANYLKRRPVEGLKGTLHLHCTDTEGEWTLDFGAEGLAVQAGHTKADTALRGPASDLYLWLWNRKGLEGSSLEVFGDRSVAEAWEQVRI